MKKAFDGIDLSKVSSLSRTERGEVEKLLMYEGLGMKSTVALGLSALIRACRKESSRLILMGIAKQLQVLDHPDFVICAAKTLSAHETVAPLKKQGTP
jgi:hypothetical protein